MENNILDLIEKHTIEYSKILRKPDFPEFEEWEKINYLDKGLVGDVNKRLELFYNQYANFIRAVPSTSSFNSNTCLWKEDELIVPNNNTLGYLNIEDIIPNFYWNHNLGWIIMSDLIRETWGNSLFDHLRNMGNTHGYYLGQTHIDVLSNYLSCQGEVILLNVHDCTWDSPSVKYRKGKVVGFWFGYLNNVQRLPVINNFKFLETSTGKIKRLSLQPYNVAFSEDHLKIVIKRVKDDMMRTIKGKIDKIEEDIESLDFKKDYLKKELDKLYEKAAYGEEILEDKFGM